MAWTKLVLPYMPFICVHTLDTNKVKQFLATEATMDNVILTSFEFQESKSNTIFLLRSYMCVGVTHSPNVSFLVSF